MELEGPSSAVGDAAHWAGAADLFSLHSPRRDRRRRRCEEAAVGRRGMLELCVLLGACCLLLNALQTSDNFAAEVRDEHVMAPAAVPGGAQSSAEKHTLAAALATLQVNSMQKALRSMNATMQEQLRRVVAEIQGKLGGRGKHGGLGSFTGDGVTAAHMHIVPNGSAPLPACAPGQVLHVQDVGLLAYCAAGGSATLDHPTTGAPLPPSVPGCRPGQQARAPGCWRTLGGGLPIYGVETAVNVVRDSLAGCGCGVYFLAQGVGATAHTDGTGEYLWGGGARSRLSPGVRGLIDASLGASVSLPAAEKGAWLHSFTVEVQHDLTLYNAKYDYRVLAKHWASGSRHALVLEKPELWVPLPLSASFLVRDGARFTAAQGVQLAKLDTLGWPAAWLGGTGGSASISLDNIERIYAPCGGPQSRANCGKYIRGLQAGFSTSLEISYSRAEWDATENDLCRALGGRTGCTLFLSAAGACSTACTDRHSGGGAGGGVIGGDAEPHAQIDALAKKEVQLASDPPRASSWATKAWGGNSIGGVGAGILKSGRYQGARVNWAQTLLVYGNVQLAFGLSAPATSWNSARDKRIAAGIDMVGAVLVVRSGHLELSGARLGGSANRPHNGTVLRVDGAGKLTMLNSLVQYVAAATSSGSGSPVWVNGGAADFVRTSFRNCTGNAGAAWVAGKASFAFCSFEGNVGYAAAGALFVGAVPFGGKAVGWPASGKMNAFTWTAPLMMYAGHFTRGFPPRRDRRAPAAWPAATYAGEGRATGSATVADCTFADNLHATTGPTIFAQSVAPQLPATVTVSGSTRFAANAACCAPAGLVLPRGAWWLADMGAQCCHKPFGRAGPVRRAGLQEQAAAGTFSAALENEGLNLPGSGNCATFGGWLGWAPWLSVQGIRQGLVGNARIVAAGSSAKLAEEGPPASYGGCEASEGGNYTQQRGQGRQGEWGLWPP